MIQVHLNILSPLRTPHTAFESKFKVDKTMQILRKNYPSTISPLLRGQMSDCWISSEMGWNSGALANRKFKDKISGLVLRAVFIPSLGFGFSVFFCSVFWWKNQKSILQLTQSG